MTDTNNAFSSHISVLLDETIFGAIPDDGRLAERVIDGTLGAGGHTLAMLQRCQAGHVLGLDLDPQALALARQRLAEYPERCTIVQGSYADMRQHADALGWRDGVDAIVLDLGVSSMQLDTPERGFAFRHDGALDMRFNPSELRMTAADIVNTWDEQEMADIFFTYGEERDSRRLARVIIKNRPYETTQQLANVIESATRKEYPRKGKPVKTIHPATRIFQALRIAVNEELTILERVLPVAIDLLRPNGRLAVISFHSLEDRIVKHIFKEASTEIISPPGMQLEEKRATVRLITKKPIEANDDETAQNPRSRSAKLRIVEKL